MLADFPRWFSEISVDGAACEARWQGVSNFVKSASKDKVELLVRLAFQTKPPAGGYKQPNLEQRLAEFHQAFSGDAAYITASPRQNQILAASALAQLFSSYSFAALAVTTTALGGVRVPALPMDLVTLAENALSQFGAACRIRPDISKLRIKPVAMTFEPDLSGLQPNTPTAFKPIFDEFRSQVEQSMKGMADDLNASLDKIIEATRMADEELDMLLWVFGGRSLSVGKAFSDVPPAERSL